jgi:hypothetical protein
LRITLDHNPTLYDYINFAVETGFLSNIRTEAAVKEKVVPVLN